MLQITPALSSIAMGTQLPSNLQMPRLHGWHAACCSFTDQPLDLRALACFLFRQQQCIFQQCGVLPISVQLAQHGSIGSTVELCFD